MKIKKSTLGLFAALAVSLVMTGCGRKGNNSSLTDAPAVTGAAEKTEEQVQEELKNFAKDSSKNVDMDKIDGDELEEEESDEDDSDEGQLDAYEVSIEEAKMAQGEDGEYIVVSFDFKNNSSEDASFDQTMKVNAMQSSGQLSPAIFFQADGYDPISVAEMVKSGKKITVQKAYKLEDTETPVNITVSAFHETDGAVLRKTFKLQ